MILTTGFGDYEVICDKCWKVARYDKDEWEVFLQDLKDDGWKKRRINGAWKHYCPKCGKTVEDEE